jgi:hypothetical protein
MLALLALGGASAHSSAQLTIEVPTKDVPDKSGRWLPSHIPGTIPSPNQRQIRKARRRRHAAGDKKAFQ